MARRDKQQEIMLAAARLFADRRFHEVTLDEVARAARVGKGTIYRYFKDKEDLFFRTATSGFSDLCRLIKRRVPENASSQERLLKACFRIMAFFERRRPLFRMMQVEESMVYGRQNDLHRRWTAEREKLVDAMAEILAQGARQGLIRENIPPRTLALYLLGLLRALARDLVEEPEDQRSLELLLNLFCRGAFRDHAVREIQKEL